MADESKLKEQAREIELLPCPFCGNAPALKSCCEKHADIECGSCHYQLRGSLQATDHTEIKRRWNTRHEQVKAETADLRDRLEAYEQMFAKARQVEFTYAPEVRITTYPATSKTTLHYRDREGDWLNDPLVDTDFTGERKWKAFDSPTEAFAALTKLQENN